MEAQQKKIDSLKSSRDGRIRMDRQSLRAAAPPLSQGGQKAGMQTTREQLWAAGWGTRSCSKHATVYATPLLRPGLANHLSTLSLHQTHLIWYTSLLSRDFSLSLTLSLSVKMGFSFSLLSDLIPSKNISIVWS